MKGAILTRTGHLEISELPVPDIKRDEVLIRVMACGVCGTDVHIFNGDKGAADNPLPIVLGHEFSGIIEKTGGDVKGLCVGDRVCADPNVLCGECYYCRSGIGHFCEHMTGIGTTAAGGFAQYCAVPGRQVYKIADNISFEQGAMAEPLSCCLHGIDNCDISAGSSVVIIGGGMIGQLMLQLARLSGASRTALVEPVKEKRETGRKLGADIVIDPISENTAEALRKAGVFRADTVIECVGRTDTIEQAIETAGNKSTVMMFGLTKPDEAISVRPYEIFKKEIVLKSSYINPYTIGRAVDLINMGRIDVSSMAADVLPLEELPAVLDSSGKRAKGKYIINPWL